MIDPPEGGATEAYIVPGTFTKRPIEATLSTPPSSVASLSPEVVGALGDRPCHVLQSQLTARRHLEGQPVE
jgi:hypothetical protein